MDLVEALINVGLPDGTEDNASGGSDSAARIADYASPTIDRLRRIYLVSRGKDAAVHDAD